MSPSLPILYPMQSSPYSRSISFLKIKKKFPCISCSYFLLFICAFYFLPSTFTLHFLIIYFYLLFTFQNIKPIILGRGSQQEQDVGEEAWHKCIGKQRRICGFDNFDKIVLPLNCNVTFFIESFLGLQFGQQKEKYIQTTKNNEKRLFQKTSNSFAFKKNDHFRKQPFVKGSVREK